MKIWYTSLLSILWILVIRCDLKSQTDPGMEYLNSMKKIDIHTHVRSEADYLQEFMDEFNFKMVTISSGKKSGREFSEQLVSEQPRYFGWITGIDIDGILEKGWADKIISNLKEDFDNGAIGVKVWKSIGMSIQKENGEYLQIDDPLFDPILKFIASENKTLIAHLGEPIHAWMPTYVTKEGTPRNYWANHPEYSFYDHPEKPSYSDIMAARDHVIERYPELRFVGAHLASLEFDVDEIMMRMEMYPNFAVEIGGRMRYLMWQARGKVKYFFENYSDRIMYGTDRGSGRNMDADQYKGQRDNLYGRYEAFSQYLVTEDDIPFSNIVREDKAYPKPLYTVKGLGLSKEVLEDIFYNTPIKWFPGVEKEF